MSTTYYNTLKPKNTFSRFAKGKFMRLMVPFFAALPLILVPRLYYAQEYQGMACVEWTAGYGSTCIIENNIFVYGKKVAPTLYQKLSWLWYLPALFIDSCINYPLLAWTQRRFAGIPIDWKVDWKYPAGQVLAILVWSIPNWLVKALEGTSTLPLVYTNILFYIMWFSI